jgi:hypothetical protein
MDDSPHLLLVIACKPDAAAQKDGTFLAGRALSLPTS